MLLSRARIVVGGVVALAVTVMAACVPKAGPVDYPIPPGISASFSPSQRAATTTFGDLFCEVLGEFSGWQPCATYVQDAAASAPPIPSTISTDWTLLLVGGLGAECFAPKVETFKDAADHLATHGITSHRIPVAGFGTTDANAQTIRDFVVARNEPKFIALTHSKGAADFMRAMEKFPGDMTRVQALITVAGAVGGSWLADDLAALNEAIGGAIGQACLPAVQALSANGIDSMRRQTRQEYLARVEHTWRAYSISAVSTKDQTSKALQKLWQRLLPYGLEQDSQVMEREAIVPGGRYLGRALGDHLAVAFPFSTTPNLPASVHEQFNRNAYPRPALIEAAVRYVIDDLIANPPP
jgi:pimeloyl-ACP methyl ester carboxylesterase